MNIETKKFVAVLNKKIEIWKIMNALGHMTVWLTNSIKGMDLWVINYEDKNNSPHLASKYPYIILKADNSNKIRTLRNLCIERSISFSSFTQCMTIWTWQEQVEASKNTSELDLDYYGICLFWEKSILDEMTRKFSLWL